jgi:hypothetical protein
MSLYANVFAYDDDQHAVRLAELGVTTTDLRDAVTSGYTVASGLTSNHPRLARHFNIWSETIATLRDSKTGDGWVNDSDRNYETARHVDGRCQIAVASGTHETGLDGGTGPRTSSKKGAATQDAVANNQMTLFPSDVDALAPEEAKPPTWLLLHTYDHAKQEIRCELSLPMQMEGKTITSWSERVLLEPIPFEMDSTVDYSDFPDDDDPIEIDVARRSS